MTTPELISFIKSELEKGKTREDIRVSLLANGGWTDADLSEAFRAIMPMDNTVKPASSVPASAPMGAPANAPNSGGLPSSIKPKMETAYMTPSQIKPEIKPENSPLQKPPLQPLEPRGATESPKSPAPIRTPSPASDMQTFMPPMPVTKPLDSKPAAPHLDLASPVTISPDSKASTLKTSKPPRKTPWMAIIITIIFAVLCFFAFYFYSPQISDLPNKIASIVNSLMNKTSDVKLEDQMLAGANEEPVPLITDTPPSIDCGITISPNRNDPTTYLDDRVFKCLGESAVSCNDAEAVINDTLLPTIFKIKNENEVCKFELSYKDDSSLTDIFGRKLAGRNISCPVTATKAFSGVDSKDFVFKDTDITKPSRYAADMYFYGSVGIFFDKDFSQSAIEELGCSGTFLDSTVESLSLIKSKI